MERRLKPSQVKKNMITPSNLANTIPPTKMPKGWKMVCDSNELATNHKGYVLTNDGDKEPLTANIRVGDYSVMDPTGILLDDMITVERKSLENICSDVRSDRKRLLACLERMERIPFSAIVIEASWEKIGRPYKEGWARKRGLKPTSPNSVQGSLVAWSQRFRIPVWCVEDKYEGERVTRWLLARFAQDMATELKRMELPMCQGPEKKLRKEPCCRAISNLVGTLHQERLRKLMR